MKLLVTGGAGFIGSNFILYLLKKYPNYQVVNLDLLTYAGNLENLSSAQNHPQYRFVKGDVADSTLVNEILQEGIDVVVHFAAESHVDRSILNPDVFVKTNVTGTETLLRAALQYPIKKFVQISTDEVYGSLGAKGYFTEETPLAPTSPYSASKAGADLLVNAYHKTYGLPVNITRCSNNYGPYQYPEKLIPLMISNALENKKLPVYGDGQNIRDWLYVEDHCEAIDLVIHQGIPGETYNIGGHNEWTNIDIVKHILFILGKSADLIEFVQDRPGHDRRYAIDATKIRSQLGWVPRHPFQEGIKATIEWYVEHPEWWKPLKK